MAEVVKTTGVSKESGYLYYLGKDGNVCQRTEITFEILDK